MTNKSLEKKKKLIKVNAAKDRIIKKGNSKVNKNRKHTK